MYSGIIYLAVNLNGKFLILRFTESETNYFSHVSPRTSSTGDTQPTRRPVAQGLFRALRPRGAKGLDHVSMGDETLSGRRASNQTGRLHLSNMSPIFKYV